MNRKIFEWSVRFFERSKNARKTLRLIYSFLPFTLLIAYPALLVYAAFTMQDKLLRLVLVPLCVFVGVTLLRVVINETRPYEKYGKPSVFRKGTAGKSFPSRHTASAFIIAMTFFYVSVPLGTAAMTVALLVAASRVLSGAHYLHDVLTGAAIGIVSGQIFFFMI